VGHWPGLEVLRGNWHRAAMWEPEMDAGVRERERENWARAVARSYDWVR
jgi:glycerol kinase